MLSTIVVFGLSGVGKSHLVNGLISTGNGLVHVQASALLMAAKERETGSVVDAEHLRRDKVIDNQALLLEAFAAFRSAETRAIVLVAAAEMKGPVIVADAAEDFAS